MCNMRWFFSFQIAVGTQWHYFENVAQWLRHPHVHDRIRGHGRVQQPRACRLWNARDGLRMRTTLACLLPSPWKTWNGQLPSAALSIKPLTVQNPEETRSACCQLAGCAFRLANLAFNSSLRNSIIIFQMVSGEDSSWNKLSPKNS